MKFKIWMGEHYSQFDHGLLHLEDGSSLPLKAWIHASTYGADSVLIADQECYECADFPVRWFTTPAGIEFYCWDNEVEIVILHNETGADVTVKGYGVLPVGESREYINKRTKWWECPVCGMKYRKQVADELNACSNCGLELGDPDPEEKED